MSTTDALIRQLITELQRNGQNPDAVDIRAMHVDIRDLAVAIGGIQVNQENATRERAAIIASNESKAEAVQKISNAQIAHLAKTKNNAIWISATVAGAITVITSLII